MLKEYTCLSILTVFCGLSSSLTLPDVLAGGSPEKDACKHLHHNFPHSTFFSNQTEYVTQNTEFWSAASQLNPACIFVPRCAEDLSLGVKTVKYFQAPFAVRGGGHMPIGDSNNINSTGVLLSTSGLKGLSLSATKETLHVGAGHRWGDVYEFLEPHGLTIVGGRLGVVGVPGLLLGGGISFFSWEYGFAAANIASMTVVLASGDIVFATPHGEYADLFWALRGGGNSFGLVTSFALVTYPAPVVTVGEATYGSGKDIAKIWLDAAYNFALYGSEEDWKASALPISNWGSLYDAPTYTAIRFYNGNNTQPDALRNFTSPVLPGSNDTFQARTMNQWCKEKDKQFSITKGLRERFYVITTFADRRAMQIVHDTYYQVMNETLFGKFEGMWIAGLTPMPISKQFFAASSQRGGVPMGLTASDGPQIWYEISMTYADNPAYEAIATAFLAKVSTAIQRNLDAASIVSPPYLYLNDADKGQPVFEGYPASHVRKLQNIRSKYDPGRVFTDLMPGGWKVDDVVLQK